MKKYSIFIGLIFFSNILLAQAKWVLANGDTIKVYTASIFKQVTISVPTDTTYLVVSPYVKPVVTTPTIPVVSKNIVSLSSLGKFDATCAGTGNSIGTTTIGGRSALAFTVVKGAGICANGLRSEASMFADLKATYPYEVRYSVSYFVPTDWVNDQPDLHDVITQFHDYPTGSEKELKSPFEFDIDGDQWAYRVRSGVSSVTNEKKVNIGPVEKGKWVDFIFHLIFAQSGNGLVEIWKDGVQLTSATWKKPMGFNHAVPPFFKVGIYKWPWNPQDLACCGATNSTTHTIYASLIKLGNKSATNTDLK